MTASNLVYVAGNIAAGKTTASTRLSAALPGTLVPEEPGANPYLAPFYDDMTRWTFHTDVHFLAARALAVTRAHEPGGAPVVFDRCWWEGAIFASAAHGEGLSSDDEWATFSLLLESFDAVLPAPAVLVYLRAEPEELFERVRRRGRDYERGITLAYLTALQARYDAWIDGYVRSPVIRVNTSTTNIMGDDENLASLTHDVRASLS